PMKVQSLLIALICIGFISEARAKNPWIQKIKGGSLPGYFSQLRVHPDRYIASQGTYKHPPQLADIKTGKTIAVPAFLSLKGVPAAPSVSSRALTGPQLRERLRKMKLSGKYFQYTSIQLVYADPHRGVGGYLVSVARYVTKKPVVCPCGGAPRFLAADQMYYCPRCRKFLPESAYITEKKEQRYYHFRFSTASVLWSLTVGEGVYQSMGPDGAGKKLYLGESRTMYGKSVVTGPVRLVRIDLPTRRVDFTHKVPMPTRKRHPGAYSTSWRASGDFSRFLVYEFDEKLRGKKGGWLTNPGPRGAVVTIAKKGSHFTFNAPVEIWTAAFGIRSRFLYVNSYQRGEITTVDCVRKKILSTKKRGTRTYLMVPSASGKYLYAFGLSGITVLGLPGLKKQGFVWKNDFLGMGNTTVGQWYAMGDQRRVFISTMKIPTGSALPDHSRHGFSLFSLLR
ncbi:hypothetical protein KKF84_21610, partial [Myxococcota bacterium]|nr:hypothetical protein [Myxococcota bacterium]